MQFNWKEEVEKRKDQQLTDLFRLLRIDSVRNDDEATPEAPVGPGPLRALEEFMQMVEEDGFTPEQFGSWAGRFEVGEGDELMGILGHLDVVPAGSGWKTDPFEPTIIDGKLYARGALDDKGPMMAAYQAIKILTDLGVKFNKRIHFIVGTDEESDWQCLDYYFKHAEMPDFGFSPDAYFPIINGEKGNVSAHITFASTAQDEENVKLINFEAGSAPNMVADSAVAVIEGVDPATIDEKLTAYLDSTNDQIKGNIEVQKDEIKISFQGKSAHGAMPERGVNAGTHLANFLSDINFGNQSAQEFIQLITKYLHDSTDGAKAGIIYTDELMGDLSMNIGIATYNPQKGGFIDANIRFPQGTSADTIQKQFQETFKNYQTLKVDMGSAMEPHYVPKTDPLVETLLDVYEEHTNTPGYETIIGGGTYARLMPKGVAYGALFPESEDVMHQANEYINLDDLFKATAIYCDAIYRLTR